MRFGNGDCVLVVDVWLHRVDEDSSGLTFEEWDPSADTDDSEAPVAMIVNSSELRAAGFDLREVLPLQLEAEVRGGQRKRKHRCASSVNGRESNSLCEWSDAHVWKKKVVIKKQRGGFKYKKNKTIYFFFSYLKLYSNTYTFLQRTRDVALKQIHGMGTRRYVLSVDNDNDFRSRCE